MVIDSVDGVNGEKLSFTGGTAEFYDKNAAKKVSVTFDVSSVKPKVTGGRANINNYAITYNTQNQYAEIQPKDITISVPQSAVPASKVYDATTTCIINSFDAVTGIGNERLRVSNLIGEYPDKNVGNNKLITIPEGNEKKATIEGLEETLSTNYNVTFTATGLYAHIEKKPATIRPDDAAKDYGTPEPDFTKLYATIEGLCGLDEMKNGTDYTITRVPGEKAGTYKMSATIVEDSEIAKNYAWSYVNGIFTINKVVAGVTTHPTSVKGLIFNNTAQVLINAGVPFGGTMKYAIGEDEPSLDKFSDALPKATDAGKYKVYYYVEGDENHTDSDVFGYIVTPQQCQIAQKPINDSEIKVDAIEDQTYTGYAIEAKPNITFGDYVLKEGTDYELSYKDNISKGTATVTIKGIGNFSSETTTTFNITPNLKI